MRGLVLLDAGDAYFYYWVLRTVEAEILETAEPEINYYYCFYLLESARC